MPSSFVRAATTTFGLMAFVSQPSKLDAPGEIVNMSPPQRDLRRVTMRRCTT
jgi:hypothetical protein